MWIPSLVFNSPTPLLPLSMGTLTERTLRVHDALVIRFTFHHSFLTTSRCKIFRITLAYSRSPRASAALTRLLRGARCNMEEFLLLAVQRSLEKNHHLCSQLVSDHTARVLSFFFLQSQKRLRGSDIFLLRNWLTQISIHHLVSNTPTLGLHLM